MIEKSSICFGVLVAVLLPGLVRAQTVYDDGGDHTVSGASGPISVQKGPTTLNVVSPAVVTGSLAVQSGAAIVGGSGTAINLQGGSVEGGIVTYGAFSSFGGSLTGGLSIRGDAPVLIAGGSFQGASNSSSPVGGDALDGGLPFNYTSNVTILGGTFVGGSGTGLGVVGRSLFLTGNFSIAGGSFNSDTAFGAGETNASLFLGQFGAPQYGAISGGTFGKGASGSGLLAIEENSGSEVDISGGSIGGSMLDNLQDRLSRLDFFGSDLSWMQTGYQGLAGGSGEYEGLLVGALADGSPVDLAMQFFTPFSGSLSVGLSGDLSDEELTFGVYSVPEPSSAVILGVGVMAVAVVLVSKRARLGSTSARAVSAPDV